MSGTFIAPIFQFVDDDVVNFGDNHLASVHPKLEPLKNGTASKPGDQIIARIDSRQNIAPLSKPELTARKDGFKKAMSSYLQTHKGKEVRFDMAQHFSWADVQEEVRTAQDRYHGATDNGILKSMRGKLRSFDECAGRVESWLKFLPSDAWQFSLVCGGLKLVLKAAIVIGKMRVDICEALEAIPEVIANTETLKHLYPTGELLRGHASKLYVSILDVLEMSLAWYDTNPLKKFGTAFWRAGDYTKQLDEALQKLNRLKGRVNEQASINSQVLLRDVEQNTLVGAQYAAAGYYYARNTKLDTAEMKPDVKGIRSDVAEMMPDIKEVRRYMSQVERDVIEIKSSMKAGFQELLRDNKANARWMSELKRYIRDQDRRFQLQQSTFNRERKVAIQQMLRSNPALANKDLQLMLTAPPATLDDAKDRIAHLMQCSEITLWLSTDKSSTLIINGGESHHGPESATSLFTGMLVRGVQSVKSNIVISWFRAQNLYDPVQRMLRNLISQLLDQISAEVDLPEIGGQGHPDHIGDLLELLRTCLDQQLQYTPVFVVLDAVSHYEDQYRGRDLCKVFNRLASLTTARSFQGQPQRHPLKILITSPIRVSDIGDCRAAIDAIVLDAPDDVDGAIDELDEMDVARHTKALIRR